MLDNILKIFIEKSNDLIAAILEHVKLSFISLLIAIIIAIPLGILIQNKPKLAKIILQISGIIQTIPSLALLGFLIPVLGVGTIPAIIMLAIYAIFPILQNTYTGLQDVNPRLKEAASSFGISKWMQLYKVELPLAKNVIISGIQTALILIIGTATIAALVGAGGLGDFILLGISRNNTELLLIGAFFASLLSIITMIIIGFLKKVKFIYTVILLLSTLLLLIMPNLGNNQNKIIIAGKLGTEPEILINMYQDLIKKEYPNVEIELKPNFGQTNFLFSALNNHSIDIYPEFSGTILKDILKSKGNIHDENQVYKTAKQKIEKSYKIKYLAPTSYNNTYGIIVENKFAQKYQLHKISDLTNISK